MNALRLVLLIALWVFFVLLVARLIVDWIQVFARSWRPQGAMVVLLEVVYSATDPPLKALRRVLPPLRLGSVAFDIGFLVLIIAVQILIQVVSAKL